MFFGDELQRMKKKHDYEMKKMELQNKLNMEKQSLVNQLKTEKEVLKNNLTVKKLRNDQQQLPIKQEIFRLNIANNEETNLRKKGIYLLVLAFFITIVSAMLTIAGGTSDFSKNLLTLTSFVVTVSIMQISIYIIAVLNSLIKDKFQRYDKYASIIKISLIIVSVSYNFEFFYNGQNFLKCILLFLFCIMIDFFSVFLVGLGYDMKYLNYTKYQYKYNLNKENTLILNSFQCNSKLSEEFDNSVKNKDVYKNYSYDNYTYKNNSKKEKAKQFIFLAKKIFNNYKFKSTIKKVKKIINKKYSQDENIKTTEIRDMFKNEYDYKQAFEILKNDKLIYTKNRRTYKK